jgi:cell division protein FtsW
MKSARNHIDLPILLSVLILMVLSLGVVYSASAIWAQGRTSGGAEGLLGSHALKVLIGVAMIFLLMQIDYRKYRKLTKPALILAIGLLLVTVGLGVVAKGAARWVRVGGLGIQPSEFAKYALVFHLSALIALKQEAIRDWKLGFLPMMVWIGTVTVLILIQPNFSTGTMVFGISMIMLYLARAKTLHIGATLGALVPLLIIFMLAAPYRVARISSMLHGGEKSGGNYQLTQGIIGFGNGGLIGVGPGESRQRDLFLPEAHGDFVFSIVGEEYGLVGTIFFLTLFVTILIRGMRVAKHARDDFGRVLASGITLTITLYALVNAAVTLGLLPTTGLPMPFVSYGGSAMIFSAAAIGVLLNISSQTDLHPRLSGAPDGVRPVDPIARQAVGKVY